MNPRCANIGSYAADFTSYRVCPIAREIAPRFPPVTEGAAWEPLQNVSRSPKAAARLFGSTTNLVQLSDELSSYIRQAHDYFVGGSHVPSTSSALLYYYCALQLAKAELLTVNPTKVLGVRIGHGLSHDISHAGDPANDFVTVREGVFPLLYEHRTGVELPIGTQLRIDSILEYLPEVATEMRATFDRDQDNIWLYHAVVSNGPELWSVLLAYIHPSVNPSRISEFEDAISGSFEEILLAPNWHKLFGISYRAHMVPKPRMFQSRKTHPSGTTIDEISWATAKPFAHSLDNCIYEHADAFYWPKYDGHPMTASLARYIVVYYLSSIVRYKPSILSQNNFPDYAWIFESFAKQSGEKLVINAADAILKKWHVFNVSVRF